MQLKGIGLIVFLFFAFSLQAQEPLTFKNQNLLSAIQSIENSTDLVFNFSPQLLKQYNCSGRFTSSNLKDDLDKLLLQTPLTFRQRENIIILFPAPKQVYRICGNIKDAVSKTTLPLAHVYSADYAQGVESDQNGQFELILEAHKHQSINISYVGYLPLTIPIYEFESQKCKDLFLEIDPDLLGTDIIVTDYLLDGIEEGEAYSAVSLDFDLLSKRHSSMEHDILKTIQLIPGITSLDESASNIQIRGSAVDQNLVVWENATLYNTGHFFGMISAINPFVIDDVKVYKGVYEPSYDNRVGGVVDMSLQDSIAQKWKGGIGTTFTEAHAYLELPLVKNKLSLLAAGRKTINQLYVSPTLWSYRNKVFQETKVTDHEPEEVEETFDYHDWNLKLLFQPNAFLNIKASAFQSYNNYFFENPLFEEYQTSDGIDSKTTAYSTTATLNWGQKLQTDLSFTASTFDNYSNSTFKENESELVIGHSDVFNLIKDHTFALTNHYQIHSDWKAQFGANFNQKQVNFIFDTSSPFEPDYRDDNAAIGTFQNYFASIHYQKKKVQFSGGFRLTKFIEIDEWDYSPRFNFQFALSPAWKLKLSGGLLHQYIGQLSQFGYNDLDVNNPVWILTLMETDMNQQSTKLAIGFIYHNKGWLFDLDAYYHRTIGLSTISPLVNSDPHFYEFSTGSSIAKGIDVLLKKRWKNYAGWLNYSLSQNTFNFANIRANRFPASNDQRHNLSFVNTWTRGNWHFNATYQYRTGLRYSEPLEEPESYFDEEDEETYYYLDFEEFNSKRLEDYHRLDLSVSYQHVFPNSSVQLEYAFSLLNVLNRDNSFSLNFDIIDEEEEEDDEIINPQVISIEKFLISRTPLLLVRMKF